MLSHRGKELMSLPSPQLRSHWPREGEAVFFGSVARCRLPVSSGWSPICAHTAALTGLSVLWGEEETWSWEGNVEWSALEELEASRCIHSTEQFFKKCYLMDILIEVIYPALSLSSLRETFIHWLFIWDRVSLWLYGLGCSWTSGFKQPSFLYLLKGWNYRCIPLYQLRELLALVCGLSV